MVTPAHISQNNYTPSGLKKIPYVELNLCLHAQIAPRCHQVGGQYNKVFVIHHKIVPTKTCVLNISIPLYIR